MYVVTMYVTITTIRKYHKALEILLKSLPSKWNYILVYQNEPVDAYSVKSDGNIEVQITQNLYDYGVFVGVNMLIRDNIVPNDSWFLVLHDTCKAGPRLKQSIEDVLALHGDNDIIWLCCTGQCNLCLLRNVIPYGNSVYNGMQMTKQNAIDIEYQGKDSIKTFPCKQHFIGYQVLFEYPSDVYNDSETFSNRITVRFENVDLEKYYVYR